VADQEEDSLKAAVYARKSTEQDKGASGASISIERQIEQAREFAAAKGWTVDAAHIYTDDALSGADFVNRVGLTCMLAAAESTPRPFDVLVAMDETRIGRHRVRTDYTLLQLHEAGVVVWFYSDGREAKLDTALGSLMETLQGFGAEVQREKGRASTRGALRSKHKAGYAVGASAYGFDHVREGAHVRLQINETQAAIVRRIFELSAAGNGAREIARELNRAHAPAPRGGQEWVASTVRHMLKNPVYKGVFIHGRTRNIDKGGKRVQVKALASEIQTRVDETLRIVPEPLWTSAQYRIATAREKWSGYRRGGNGQNGGKLTGRPEGQTTSQHLLGGLLRCGECGAMLIPTSRVGKGEKTRRYYACARRYKQGSVNCPFKHLVPYDAITDAVLSHFAHLHEGALDEIIDREWQRWITEQSAAAAARDQRKADVERLDVELGRLAEAIADGEPIPALVKALREKQTARDLAAAQLEHSEGGLIGPAHGWSGRMLGVSYSLALGTLRETLERRGSEGRGLLKMLIPEPLSVTLAYEDGQFVGWDYSGKADLGEWVLGGRISQGHVGVTHAQNPPRC
jgi:DNA invertase Pin-like site-specific DNA recombinase